MSESALRVLSVSNQKGGVGKTTTAINLGTALAAVGEHVLLIDLDPQGNASTGLGMSRGGAGATVYDVVVNGAAIAEAARPTALPGLDLLGCDPALPGAEIELATAPRRSFRLRDALQPLRDSQEPGAYTYVHLVCRLLLEKKTVNETSAT